MDTSLSVEDRVDDLVGRMTLEEKISQMSNSAPAIERLGIPEYNWWNEGLHGVARAGLATVYPQAIGLGATWDEDLMFKVSTAISDEARAKHHNFVNKGKRFLYQGLTLWSPNINIFRDPRWGRGQETYGEDPYLTGRLAVQFVKGLQGDDPNYFKTIATVKHFAVHSGPEPERHSFDAVINQRDFQETYLPQFEMGIKEGHAYSIMCAYNRLNGEACCGSDKLLTDLLRKDWGFQGYVVSDCDAVEDIYQHHKIVATPEEAAALAVRSGCDLSCGKVFKSLNEAVDEKLITEEEIDVAVKRLFTARFKLGMFDPPEMVKYAQIPYAVVDSKENKALALQAARESIVLLENKGNLLPLKKENAKTVAVIGPNADQWLMLLGNYNGVPSDPITPLRGIREKLGAQSKVLFAQGCELAEGMPMFYTIPSNLLYSDGSKNGVNAEYYNNNDLSGDPLYTTLEPNLDANWYDKAPREDMDDDNFSVRWTTELVPDQTGKYQLGFIGTCNTKLYLNDSLVARTVYPFRDEYGDPRLRKSDPIELAKGKRYKIKVEAIESFADAQVQLVWAAPKPELKKQALEIAKQADVIIMCMGITSRMEGEEMDVVIDGFRGGDRTKLDLPGVQSELIKSIHALGKPIVLVLLNGSALAVNWEKENIPAIIEAWYPGQAAGQAIADVLFGDYNPGGKLPVTFYTSEHDLPAFDDYSLTKQTYRYFNGKPLYPFGYGLSYTTFVYDNLRSNDGYHAGDTVRMAVDVKNDGKVAGDEVVQLYVSNKSTKVPVPIKSLKGFKRIHLEPGEVRTVNFVLSPDAFSVINENNKREILPGEFEIFVGGGQPSKEMIQATNGILTEVVLQ
ncbi:MAG TPA: glycoside hydrolase family 3 C-terminal domain-containing protein [Cyclobacteriaceae bacterium]|nr:glycoside hydrolase family 3 C-terminal domain-containing protein [Cyclobacteriaceae bacterium]